MKVVKRLGSFFVDFIDGVTLPLALAAAVVYPVEYVENSKTRRDIRQALKNVLEREHEQVLKKEHVTVETVPGREEERVRECSRSN